MSIPLADSDRLRLPRGASRRDVLRWALSGAGIAALGPMVGGRLPVASGAPLGQKILVIVNLDGGCDMLSGVVPATLAGYVTRRPTLAVGNADSLALTGGPGTPLYRLHPELHTVRDLWDAGDVALVHRVGYPKENLSHFESQDIYAYGVRDGFIPLSLPTSGWVGRYAERFAPTPMGAVSIGQGRPRLFVGGASNPLQVGSLSGFRFNADGAFSQNHAYRLQVVQQMLGEATTTGTPGEVRAAISQAHDLSGQVQTALAAYNAYLGATNPRITYPATSIGNALKDVAALIHGGFETRVFYAGYGGFDTHGAQGTLTGSLPTLFQRLDDAVAAFVADMKNLGQWENVVLAVVTEFGRRNYENGSAGTDHGGAFTEILLGGAVNGGVYGPDLSESDLSGEYLKYAVDFRDVWREVVTDHLGGDGAAVFPETQPTQVVLGVV